MVDELVFDAWGGIPTDTAQLFCQVVGAVLPEEVGAAHPMAADFPEVVVGSAVEVPRVTGSQNGLRLARAWRHLWTRKVVVERLFGSDGMRKIEETVTRSEKLHTAEIAFVLEAALTPELIWKRISTRQRAVELFARFGVWDTEENNGILVYVLIADRTVELVADRGLSARIAPEKLTQMATVLSDHYKAGQYADGTCDWIERELTQALVSVFPAVAGRSNLDERANRPVQI